MNLVQDSNFYCTNLQSFNQFYCTPTSIDQTHLHCATQLQNTWKIALDNNSLRPFLFCFQCYNLQLNRAFFFFCSTLERAQLGASCAGDKRDQTYESDLHTYVRTYVRTIHTDVLSEDVYKIIWQLVLYSSITMYVARMCSTSTRAALTANRHVVVHKYSNNKLSLVCLFRYTYL